MSLQTAAMNVSQGSLAHSFAVQLCLTRGLDPHGFTLSSMGLPNWQAEIYRVLLETGLEIAVRNNQ